MEEKLTSTMMIDFRMDVDIKYSVKKEHFQVRIKRLHYKGSNESADDVFYIREEMTLKDTINELSRWCLEEYRRLSKWYGYKHFVFNFKYTNNRVHNMLVSNLWIDQLKNLTELKFIKKPIRNARRKD